ncbi:hypothetical protein [Microbacterium memoriense]|uniref:DUF222 domain-containing protein n=1 Tax=Microbacterium memoriense TaxID=2978350 RepID=A0ABT2P871_9MICO|nr:hypothetical protein [Microbacterium memoriense]MCT9000790.1 hypothetical protein [Microbacterium memoriense]
MTDTNLTALRQFYAAVHVALSQNDPDKTPEANERARRGGLARARADLAARIPSISEPSGPDRAAILAGIRPTTADSLAVAAREREKVQALLAAGRRYDQIIPTASRERLGAILDDLEILPEVLASSEGPEIVAEFEAHVFDRLATLGHEPAVERLRAEETIALPNAWSRVMTEALTGPVTVGAHSALYRADAEACREAQGLEISGLGEGIVRSDREQERADLAAPQSDAA